VAPAGEPAGASEAAESCRSGLLGKASVQGGRFAPPLRCVIDSTSTHILSNKITNSFVNNQNLLYLGNWHFLVAALPPQPGLPSFPPVSRKETE
jgi:hypothetical protein